MKLKCFIGNHNFYLPSQSLFLNKRRSTDLKAKKSGEVVQIYEVPVSEMREQKTLIRETNPSFYKTSFD